MLPQKEILKQCCHKCDDYSESWEVTCRDCECHWLQKHKVGLHGAVVMPTQKGDICIECGKEEGPHEHEWYTPVGLKDYQICMKCEIPKSREKEAWFGDNPEQQNCPKAGAFGHWHCRPPQSTQESWEKLKEDLRDEFEELFPKDQEAIDGIRPSKSNRSAGLVLWAKWEVILRKALSQSKEEGRQMMLETVKELSKEKEEDIAQSKQETEEKMYDMWYSGEVEEKVRQETLDEIVKMVEEMKKATPYTWEIKKDQTLEDVNDSYNQALSDLIDKLKNIK